MSSFIIWPSEAVFLGIFLEEYLQAREDHEKTSILDYIDSHLRCFAPDMAKYSTFAVSESELPPDVDWKCEAEVAISLSTRRVFLKLGNSIREHRIVDSTRKSLADLIHNLVFPFAGKSLFDRGPKFRTPDIGLHFAV